MSRPWRWILVVVLVVGAAAWLYSLWLPRNNAQVQAQVIGLPAGSGQGFTRADGPIELVFPRDHGPHPDYQTEWWYYTGNLATAEGRRFGYQLTFFRRAVQPAAEREPRSSAWAAEQVYLAHFTLTDVGEQRFQAFERLERGAAGLAGAAGEPAYNVWLRDWSVEQTGPDEYHLRAGQDGVQLDLTLIDLKGPILQGDQGYSRKGPEPGNASIYYSQTRLQSAGKIAIGEEVFTVGGLSWMDREFSTSALSAGQVGWDWFSLQLEDGSELMVYAIRRADGSVDEFSKGAYIAPDGATRLLERDDFSITVEETWLSPHSNGRYPAGWTVSVPELDLQLNVQPQVKDQELNLSYTYWEGSVRVSGQRAGQPLNGYGYVELTGYAQSLEGQF